MPCVVPAAPQRMASSKTASVLGSMAVGPTQKAPSQEQSAEQEKWRVSFCLLSFVCSVCLGCPSTCDLYVSGLGGGGGGEGWLGSGLDFYLKSVPQIKKAEMDRKTLDWEIVELTNKLLDAKNTINKLEELNVCAHLSLATSCTLGRVGLALSMSVYPGAVPAGLQLGCAAPQVQQVPLPEP